MKEFEMHWSEFADYEDQQIIRQGTTHHAFVTVSRNLLLSAVEAQIAARMHVSDADVFRHNMRMFKTQARLGNHPFDHMVNTLHSWTEQLIDGAYQLAPHERISDFEGWMDNTLNRIVSSAKNEFSHLIK